jgi:hypothetical protein
MQYVITLVYRLSSTFLEEKFKNRTLCKMRKECGTRLLGVWLFGFGTITLLHFVG